MVPIERNVIFHPSLSGYTCLWAKYKQRYDISKFLKIFANFFFPPQLFLAHRSIRHPRNQLTVAL